MALELHLIPPASAISSHKTCNWTRSIHAYIIGEHGDSEVPVWSRLNVAGTPLLDIVPQFGTVNDSGHWYHTFEQVRNAAYEVIQRKGATSYAIGLAVTQIVQAIVRDQHRVLTVSCLSSGLYDIDDVYLSLPAVVNRHGVNRIVRLSLSSEEEQQLKHSAELLRETIKELQL